jgi:branched-chain amino acid transport system ATP-binding protein
LSLELKEVSSGYGQTRVIQDVSLKCGNGTITVMVGPNGAGKTTTLKAVNGLIRVWSGSVAFGGEDITRLRAFERVEKGIASCPEGRRLFPRLSTEANLRLGAYSKRARRHADETLEDVYGLFPRLKERAEVSVGRLSGGEQQMVGIGRALMARPSLVVLDEPSLGLAPKLIGEIFEKIVELRKRGLSVLLVEQNAFQALDIADYAYVLQEGKVVNEGAPSKLMDQEELKKAYFSIE